MNHDVRGRVTVLEELKRGGSHIDCVGMMFNVISSAWRQAVVYSDWAY